MNAEQARIDTTTPPKHGYEAIVPRYPRYTADADGNIRSYCGRKVAPGTVLKTTLGFGKYLSVNICDENGKRLGRYVHDLVAEAFLGPRPEGLVVDHIDGNRMNNKPSNLRYCTMKQNHDNPNNAGPNSYQRMAARKVVAIKDGVETVYANASTASRVLHLDLSSVIKNITGKIIFVRKASSGNIYKHRVLSVKGYKFRWA